MTIVDIINHQATLYVINLVSKMIRGDITLSYNMDEANASMYTQKTMFL